MDNGLQLLQAGFCHSLVCYMPLARSSRARRIGLPSHPRSRGDTRADINRCGVAIAAACIAAVAQLCKTGCSP